MRLTPEEIELLKTLGPIALSTVGLLLSSLLGLLSFLARAAWRSHRKQMALMAKALEELAKSIKHAEDENKAEHAKVWQSIQGLRAELQLSTQRADHIKAGMLKLEGALDKQVDRVDSFLKLMGRIESKLDAVFRVIDAPKRATDVGT